MELVNGYEYTVKGFEEIDKFAKGILALTNAKSSRKETVVDIKTYEGTNIVSVVSLKDIHDELESLVGEITSKNKIDIMSVEFVDLNDRVQKASGGIEDNGESIHLLIENE